ncbi:MAG: SpoIIE family protein phosphatase, partial [Dehalococcoidales bacterium]|nr:SpoIIE family protein phosphatase [Dehalococcoidales bacterium]
MNKPNWKELREKFAVDPIFHTNEAQANKLGAIILLNTAILLGVIMLLTSLGVFNLGISSIFPPAIQGIIECLVLLIIYKLVKNDPWWMKFVLILGLTLVYAGLDGMLTHKVAPLMAIPVVFSSRYFSKRLTIVTAVFTSIVFLLSAAWGATHGLINLNIVTMDEGIKMITTGGFLGDTIINAGVTDEMLIKNTLLFDYVPRWFIFSIIAVISANLARRGREMVLTQHEKDIKTTRIESELSLATKIQTALLPSTFPAFPDRNDFDIYASTKPAKEVGGDFYDFFLIDDEHLGLVIADASGKGVPAALFMLISKILIKNFTMSGRTPSEVLYTVNKQICSNNREDMFVTVWIGILNLSNGNLTASNAGHEYPILKKADGDFEIIKGSHDFVVGGMDDMRYKEYSLQMDPGSKLFLYTDGIAEATDAKNDQFGTARTVEVLNKIKDATPQELLEKMDDAVELFVGDAEQFDDMTMMCIHYKGSPAIMKEKEITLPAKNESIPEITDFINNELKTLGCTSKIMSEIDAATDDIVSNIANYAYEEEEEGNVTVSMRTDDEMVTIVFTDNGRPYNPLAKVDPDITLSADERPIGGLGILMIKKMMDEVDYRYLNGRNNLIIKKKL